MLWLGIHLPLLPLEICQAGCVAAATPAAADPEPASVVTEDGRVLLRNAAARQAGIAVGTSLATAHSIVPALTHQPRNLEREQRRLTLLGEALYGFSARVCLAGPQAGASSAGVMVEIGASLKLFGDAGTLIQRVAALCRDLGHQVQLHTAATPLAALILARAGARDEGAAAGFDQVALPHAAVEPERLSPDRIERLANMGVHTLGQLLALPAQGVARRFGADLTDYLARIQGDRPDPRPTLQPAECFRTTLHLLEPLSDKQALAFPMQRLLGDLQHWLVARQLGARQICWHFAPAVGEGTRMPVHFARPRQSRADFLDITRLQLGEAELPDEVLDITLEARRLLPWSPDSGSLFAGSGDVPGNASGFDELAGKLVDQLHARLGPGTCYSLACTGQHTPEQAWRPTFPLQPGPQSGRPRKAQREAPPEPGGPGTDERPLWLFDPPRPVRRAALTLLRGPERIHTGWWLNEARQAGPAASASAAGHARDYYVARHRDGAQCWVFVDPWERWFLHGYFA